MKQTIRLMMAIMGLIFCQLILVGSPWPPKPYPQLEPNTSNKPRPPIAVPEGCDRLLSRGCAVTSSDPDPIIGELSFVTDGDKEHDVSTYVELSPDLQWIQIDLGSECEIYAICIWHFADLRAYRDVICQISNDPKFLDGVVTVFNNDHDNSAGFGIGKEMEYVETCFGRPFAVDAVKGRYIRCYSRGNIYNSSNHYTEVEVFGKPPEVTLKTNNPTPSFTVSAQGKTAHPGLYDNLPEPPQGKVWLKIEYPRWGF